MDYFTVRMFIRQLIPIMISAVALAFGDMADAIVVGNRMGVTGLAAISISLPVFMVINIIMHGLGSGGSIRYAKLQAKGEKEKAAAGFQGVILTAVFFGIALAVLGNLFLAPILEMLGAAPDDKELFQASRTYIQIIISGTPLFFISYILNYYLRSDDQEKLAGFGFTAGNLTDISLNIILVLGMRMGVKGAAWATLAGLIVSVSIYLWGMYRNKSCLVMLPLRPSAEGLGECIRVGLSTSSQYFFSMIFILTANRMLMRLGGSAPVAVFEMIQSTSFLLLYLYDGVAKAAQPLVSNYSGERNQEGCRKTLETGLIWGTVIGGLAAALVMAFPDAVCMLLGIRSGEALRLGRHALRIYAPSAVIAGISMILESYFQASSQEKSAFTIAFLRGAAVLIPLTVLFSFTGTEYFWFVFPLTELISLIAALLIRKCFLTQGINADEGRVYTKTIRSKDEDMQQLLKEAGDFCGKWESTIKQQFFINLAIEELCMAILTWGFGKNEGYIQITLIAEQDGSFELHIRDDAVSFNPFSMDSGKAGSEEDFNADALGIMVIKEKARDFSYRRYQGFNTLVVRI